MGILEKIKDIELEIARTQKNKATEHHLGMLKAKLAKFRAQLLEPPKGAKGGGDGFEVTKSGDARVAMIGFPSVGKSTILSHFTKTESEISERDFTTLTCIPGMLYYNNCKIQLLDLPGIIEGASEGKGKGRQVIAVAKSADVIMIVLDASKYKDQREKILRELDLVGIRINKEKPQIIVKPMGGGGVQVMSPYKLTKITQDDVRIVLHEYKILNAQVIFKDDYDIDDLIDTLEGNRRYTKALFVYNKIDMISVEELDKIAKEPHSIGISCNLNLGTGFFLEKLWEYLALVRIYTKKKGCPPDFNDPIVLRKNKGGFSVLAAIKQIHKDILLSFRSSIVWGKSVKYSPMMCGLSHELQDEDVFQILKKSNK